jgi:Eukaryotic aspartyl protease
MTIGYYDKTRFKGELSWYPVKLKEQFAVELDDVFFNGHSIGLCENRQCLITFDSGTTYHSMPGYAIEMLK